MAGFTDKPSGSRPYCDECGEHRWSWDGRCLGSTCKPLSEILAEIEAGKVKRKTRKKSEALVDPTTGKKRSKPSGKSRKEADAWYKSRGEVPPWEENRER